MKPRLTPFTLNVWMLATRVFSLPISLVAKFLHRRMGADPNRFSERLGVGGTGTSRDVIWIHAASLGEVMQIGSLANYLSQSEESDILVTTTTAAGAEWVAREMPDAIHRYVPIDTPSAVQRFLDGWSFRVAIFVEGDLWPRLVRESQRRGIPQVLLNARHSRSRERLPAVFASLLVPFSLITCRSERVAGAIRSLGVPKDRVRVLPDLRLTMPRLAAAPSLTAALRQAIGARPLWLAASTHRADEDAVLEAHLAVLRAYPEALLIIAPRHPRRGEPLAAMTRNKGLDVALRSRNGTITASTQVYIADTLGELGAFFDIAPVTFMGGSFGQEGGHNPYEPAAFGVAIVSGSEVRNFADAYATLIQAGAALQVEQAQHLGAVLTDLLGSAKAEKMGEAGLAYLEASRDSVAELGDLIAHLMRPRAGQAEA